MTVVAVLVAGFIGACLRQEIFSGIQGRTRLRFPVGILVVNLTGAFLLGLLHGAAVDARWPHWLAVGVQTGAVGAYTTYSTWAVDSTTLGRQRRPLAAAANLVGSLTIGALLCWAGITVGHAAWSRP